MFYMIHLTMYLNITFKLIRRMTARDFKIKKKVESCLTYKNFFSFRPLKLKPELSLSLSVRVRLHMLLLTDEINDFFLKNS